MAAKSKKRTRFPVDVKKLTESVDGFEESRAYPSYVNILIDVTASDRLIDAVLGAFDPQNDNAEVRHALIECGSAELPMPCDLCVVVAGESLRLGRIAAESRRLGCPTAVAIEVGETYFAASAQDAAELLGFDEADAAGEEIEGIPEDTIVEVDFNEERPLDELGRWIAANAPAKRVSMAASFPFIRLPLAMELTRAVALKNAGVGVVFIVPGADMPVITLNQAMLVLQIAALYGQPLDAGRIVEVAAVVAGAFGFRALARELSSAVPALGWGIKGTVAYTGTMAMGKAAVECFEEGGRINELSAKIREAVDAAAAVATEDDL